jgi:Na+/H+ antiporter NhaA
LLHLVGTAFLAGIGFTMPLFSGLPSLAHPSRARPNWSSLLGSWLAATVGILILLTTRQLEPDSTHGAGACPPPAQTPSPTHLRRNH